MTDNNLSNVFKDALQEGEKILWTGKPGQFALVNDAIKTSLLLRWIISAVVGIAVLAVYIIAYAGSDTFQPLIIVIVVAVVVFLVARPVTDRNTLLKKVSYCITDKRVLFSDGRRDAYELARNGLKVSFVEGENGGVHAALGSCCDVAQAKLRSRALAPKRGKNDAITGFVLYNVDSAVRDFFVS